MKFDIGALFISLIFLLLLILLGSFLILESLNMNVGVEKVPCYDRYGNLIQGLICNEEITMEEKLSFFLLGIVVIIIGIPISYVVYDSLTFSFNF